MASIRAMVASAKAEITDDTTTTRFIVSLENRISASSFAGWWECALLSPSSGVLVL